MTITKQQFDTLEVGDTLKNEDTTLVVQGTLGEVIIVKIIFVHKDEKIIRSNTYCIEELISGGYSIIQSTQNNCGFPYGDYSDRECLVKVSDSSIDDCMVNAIYIRLMNVSKAGFQDHNGEYWMYAVLVSNNVDLVKPWTNY